MEGRGLGCLARFSFFANEAIPRNVFTDVAAVSDVRSDKGT